MNGESPTTTVVIATLNRPRLLQRCLEALANQTTSPEAVLVVGAATDTASQDAVRRMRLSLPMLKWLNEEQGGHVPPVRQATLQVDTDFVVWLDDDAYPLGNDWLARLTDPFRVGDVACVGGPVIETQCRRVPRDAGAIRWYGRRMGNVGGLQVQAVTTVSSVPEGNCIWRTKVIQNLEFATELQLRYPLHYGLDLALQAKRQGWRTVFTPHAAVMHTPDVRRTDANRDSVYELAYAYAHNLTFIALRHFPTWQRVFYLLWAILFGDGSMNGLGRAIYSASRGANGFASWLAATRGHIAAIRLVAARPRGSSR